jgi:hypothetical protein
MGDGAIQARPTLYKGIQMRSRLEADYAAFMDQAGWGWKYEPIVFAGPSGQWLPDFELWPESRVPSYVELKPESWLQEDARVAQTLDRMEIAWLSEPKAVLYLVFWRYGCRSPEPFCWIFSMNECDGGWRPGAFERVSKWLADREATDEH